jgi:hypothetical protein
MVSKAKTSYMMRDLMKETLREYNSAAASFSLKKIIAEQDTGKASFLASKSKKRRGDRC